MDQSTEGDGSLQVSSHPLLTALFNMGSQQLRRIYPVRIIEIWHLVEAVVVLPQLKIPAPIFTVGFGVFHRTEYTIDTLNP